MSNRSVLSTRALAILGDSTLSTEVGYWWDSIWDDIDSFILLKHLSKTGTGISTSNGDDSYALPTDYFKALSITSSNSPYELTFISPQEMEVLRRLGDTGNPEKWTIIGTEIIVYPKPITGALPTLTPTYYTAIVRPADAEDVTTKTGLTIEWYSLLIQGLVAYGWQFLDDVRADRQMERWITGLLAKNVSSSQTNRKGGAKPGTYKGLKSIGGLPRRR